MDRQLSSPSSESSCPARLPHRTGMLASRRPQLQETKLNTNGISQAWWHGSSYPFGDTVELPLSRDYVYALAAEERHHLGTCSTISEDQHQILGETAEQDPLGEENAGVLNDVDFSRSEDERTIDSRCILSPLGDEDNDVELVGLEYPTRHVQDPAENLPHLPDEYKIEHFPSEHAGAPIQPGSPIQSDFHNYQQRLDGDNEYAPFVSQIDWEIARWAKIHGPSSAAVTELLGIDGVVQSLALSYKNARELNILIDDQLPSRPRFRRFDLQVGGEEASMYARDLLQCIQAIYGDPAFTHQLIHKPERHYRWLGDQWHRVYHDMHTGNWWWAVQSVLEARKPGATIVPLILSSDRTQVTSFGSKTAYPVYLTIGNVPKVIRRKPSQRAQILLAYLPTSKLPSVAIRASQRRMIANLFHACLRRLLAPLDRLGIEGIIMTDGNGIKRRIHPILAVYVGDYPEQLLVTCIKTGECPKCDVARDDIGQLHASASMRDLNAVLRALSKAKENARGYISACKRFGIKPVYHPFWEPLPYVDIFQAITPDILHQLHQGVFKHLVSWLVQAYGASEIDARVQRLIPNHHIHIFPNGISRLSRVTGKEHNFISRVILGVVSDMCLPGGFNASRLVRAVRALLDFMFLAQNPVISACELNYMEGSLKTFHENKAVFVDLGIREHFLIPKLHALKHYVTSIQLFGSTDNYNTQHTERLHIDYTKDAYRATNTRDEYPQMTVWLERREKIERHEKYINWRNHTVDDTQPLLSPRVPSPLSGQQINMTRFPTVQAVSIDDVVSKYGATFFYDAFARFVVLCRNPEITRTRLESEALDVHIPFRSVAVYHRIRFKDCQEGAVSDAIHVQPPYNNKKGQSVPGRFDTALVQCGLENLSGIHAYRVAQVRVVFSIGPAAIKLLFRNCETPPRHLAYVEWFTPFRARPDPNSKLYNIERSRQGNARIASIIPVTDIAQSVHLSPVLSGRSMPREWDSNNILDNCRRFAVNVFSDTQTYLKYHIS
ncbi:hypothetical protein JOM56_014933 [Amanita muscaria]